MRGRARRALLLLVVAAFLALSACTLELDVQVELEGDGSGQVVVLATLDAEAVARVGGDLESVVALDELRADGWSVDGPTRDGDGGQVLRLRQPFADPDEAEEVFADLAGEGGPFRDLTVAREQSLLETRWRFSGSVDLERDAPVPRAAAPPADDAGGLGEEPEEEAAVEATLGELADRLGASLDRVLQLRVGVRLPGDVESNATTRADNGAVWQVRFGDGPLDLAATGRSIRPGVVAGIVVVALAAVVGLVALLVRLAARSTSRRTAP